jgi:hypothetical protein
MQTIDLVGLKIKIERVPMLRIRIDLRDIKKGGIKNTIYLIDNNL